MTELTIWFERKFKFEFPVELYPNLCMRLRGTPARLEELVRDLTTERLVRQLDGKWSIQETPATYSTWKRSGSRAWMTTAPARKPWPPLT